MTLGAPLNPANSVVMNASQASRVATGSLSCASPVNKPAAMAVAGITLQLMLDTMDAAGWVTGTDKASFRSVIAPAVMMIPAGVAIPDQAPGSLTGSFGTMYTPMTTPIRSDIQEILGISGFPSGIYCSVDYSRRPISPG